MKTTSKPKRKVDLVVISDVHLGTYGCHATELLHYLQSIEPGEVILNGDIIDVWQFSKRYWPDSHMQLVQHLLGMVAQGIPVHYLTGNHDELLRRFAGFRFGSLQIANKLVKTLSNGQKAWFFHGDVFDVTMQNSKWLAKLGGWGYDALIVLNRAANSILEATGQGKFSLSKKIKNSVKSAVSYISSFEQTAAEMAIFHGHDVVVCGHIHQPTMQTIETRHGAVTYLNSGDWVENLTALEYHDGEWTLFHYEDQVRDGQLPEAMVQQENPTQKELFQRMWLEFQPQLVKSGAQLETLPN
ncbi:MAG: UDP-2,3-diacylglucosamine diphosphatase [Bacteroidia bacterium]